MKKGTQIVRIPDHANGDINHPDVDFGFVMTSMITTCACRYWKKGQPGVLRTVANSETTPRLNLQRFELLPQFVIEKTIKAIEKGDL